MRLFVNEEIQGAGGTRESQNVWSAQNGATRRTLVVINTTKQEGKELKVDVGTLDKGNHSFIFLNPEKKSDTNRVVGLFLNRSYGYTVVEEHSPEDAEIYTASSVGGYGNSESKFGLYKVGTILAVHSYKHRQGDTYWKLTESGWEELGRDIPLSSDEINII